MIVRLPPLHPSQALVRQSPARFKVLSCGRRWGKTLLGGSLCVATALQGGRAWWVAPTYKTSNPGWRVISGLASQIPGAVIRRGDREILFGRKGIVTIRSAENWKMLKGDKLNLLVMDECALIKEAAWSESLRPTLTDYAGSAVFISTPTGRNWFYRIFNLGISGANPLYASWQLPTSTNPFIDPAEIEAARLELPEALFEQEYLAVFLIDEGAVFRNIRACLNAPLNQKPEDHKGHTLVGGIDWASVNDFTALSIGCLTCNREVDRDRFNQIDYLLQAGRIKAIYDKWRTVARFAGFLAESNAMGEPIIQGLQDQGLPIIGFFTDYSKKGQIIRSLSLDFERQAFQFQPDPVWDTELEVYEQKVSPITGKRAYNAPEGFHDDTVIARALMRRAENHVMVGEMFL